MYPWANKSLPPVTIEGNFTFKITTGMLCTGLGTTRTFVKNHHLTSLDKSIPVLLWTHQPPTPPIVSPHQHRRTQTSPTFHTKQVTPTVRAIFSPSSPAVMHYSWLPGIGLHAPPMLPATSLLPCGILSFPRALSDSPISPALYRTVVVSNKGGLGGGFAPAKERSG